MYAIVNISGKQYKVEPSQLLTVDLLHEEEGKKIEFDQVMLIDENGKVNVGTPLVIGAKVTAKVVSHFKDNKVLVFKKKRRKGYKKLNGHRQQYSQIQIESIKK